MQKYTKQIIIAAVAIVGIAVALHIDANIGFNKCRVFAGGESLEGRDPSGKWGQVCTCMESELNLYQKLKFIHSDISVPDFIRKHPDAAEKIGKCVFTKSMANALFR